MEREIRDPLRRLSFPGLLLALLGRRCRLLLAHGAGLAAGRAFLGFAARIHFFATFLAGKDGHE